MENGKVALGKCPKCNSCGITEITRQWEMDRDPVEAVFVGYYKCESCGHRWQKILDRRPKEELEKVTPQ